MHFVSVCLQIVAMLNRVLFPNSVLNKSCYCLSPDDVPDELCCYLLRDNIADGLVTVSEYYSCITGDSNRSYPVHAAIVRE